MSIAEDKDQLDEVRNSISNEGKEAIQARPKTPMLVDDNTSLSRIRKLESRGTLEQLRQPVIDLRQEDHETTPDHSEHDDEETNFSYSDIQGNFNLLSESSIASNQEEEKEKVAPTEDGDSNNVNHLEEESVGENTLQEVDHDSHSNTASPSSPILAPSSEKSEKMLSFKEPDQDERDIAKEIVDEVTVKAVEKVSNGTDREDLVEDTEGGSERSRNTESDNANTDQGICDQTEDESLSKSVLKGEGNKSNKEDLNVVDNQDIEQIQQQSGAGSSHFQQPTGSPTESSDATEVENHDFLSDTFL